MELPVTGGLWIVICAVVGYLAVSFLMKRFQTEAPRGEQPALPAMASIEEHYRQMLGVSAGAGEPEIRAAYGQLLAKYHPDNARHLGDRYLDIAGEKTKELVEAYEYLKRKYNW